jgi:Ca2+/Na+ antiporter
MSSIGKALKSNFGDFMIVCGFSSVVYGIYEIYQPASFVIGGLMILWAFLPKTNKKAD